MAKKVRVQAERKINTYSSLFIASRHHLDRAEKREAGSFYDAMASLLFSAFTLEAYLNHLGKYTFSHWEYLERLTPLEKIELLTHYFNIEINYGHRPYQTVTLLFKFRNDIVHGKTEELKIDKVVKESQRESVKSLETRWEQYCTLNNARKARDDVKQIVEQLNNVSGVEGSLAIMGIESSTTTMQS
jgi:hypothetical protein